MSPRDWGVCPKCRKRAEESQAKLKQKVADSYGKLAPEEWLAMKERSEKAADLEETLRINYGFVFNASGQFELEFNFSCDAPGCDFCFKHENTIDVPKLSGLKQ